MKIASTSYKGKFTARSLFGVLPRAVFDPRVAAGELAFGDLEVQNWLLLGLVCLVFAWRFIPLLFFQQLQHRNGGNLGADRYGFEADDEIGIASASKAKGSLKGEGPIPKGQCSRRAVPHE